MFEVFGKKVWHKLHHIFYNEAQRFKNFGNIGIISAHEWPIYRYRPQNSHIGRSLLLIKWYWVEWVFLEQSVCKVVRGENTETTNGTRYKKFGNSCPKRWYRYNWTFMQKFTVQNWCLKNNITLFY